MTSSISYLSNFGLKTEGFIQMPGEAKADYCQNFKSQKTDGIETRQGYQTVVNSVGGYGLIDYNYIDLDGNLVEEILAVDTSLHRIKDGTLNITYSGTSPRAVAKVIVDSGEMKLKLIENGSEVLSQSLGQGYEESSTETVSDTATAISAVSNFSATVTGTSTVPSAFLDITSELSIPKGETKTIKFKYTEEVDKFVTSPFDGLADLIDTDSARNIDWVNHNGLIVLTDGKLPKVYDGGAVYIAGLPKPTVLLSSLEGSGVLTNDYTYYITYEYIDFQGKITESQWSDPIQISVTNQKVRLNIKTIEEGSGYNTKYAVCNGAQTLTPAAGVVTITVDSGHDLKAGDYAYFDNIHSSVNTEKAYDIKSVTSTTLTIITDDTVQVADDTLITNNLRINIYRATDLGVRYLIQSLPNDPRVGSINFIDNLRSATVSESDTYNSFNGLVTIKVEAGSDLQKDDIIYLPEMQTVRFVEGVSGTNLVLRSSTTIVVVKDNVLAVSDLNYPTFQGDLTTPRNPPTESDYCESYRGSLILGKNQTLYWSDESDITISSAGFSYRGSTFLTRLNRPLKGFGVSGDSLISFQDTRIDRHTTSSLTNDVLLTFEISRSIGLASHSAIAKLGERLFFGSQSGIYEINDGQIAINRTASAEQQLAARAGISGAVSGEIDKYFDGNRSYSWSRMTMGVDPKEGHVFITLPEEGQSPGYMSRKSATLLYETLRNRWFLFTNFDISGGVVFDSNFDLYFTERRYGQTKRRSVNRLLRRKDEHGYNDHVTAITKIYETKDDILLPQLAHDQKRISNLKLYNVKRDLDDFQHSPTFTVTAYKDYMGIKHSSLSFTFPDRPQEGEWDTFFWDVGNYGSWPSPSEELNFKTETVESLKLRIENNQASTNAKLNGWAIKVVELPSNLKR